MEKIAAVLIAAHIIGDFVLQTGNMAEHKNKPGYLMLHSISHGMATYLALQAWTCWQAPVFVMFIHALIDLSKHHFNAQAPEVFIIDQAIHIISLIVLAQLLVHFSWIPGFSGAGYTLIIVISGFIACVQGAGYLIANVTKQLIEKNNLQLEGLQNGGKIIGRLERCIIFLFIFIDQPVAIGFLFAAKSILRFEEAKQQKLAEYILIGTLWSFSLAIFLATATKWAIKL